MEAKNEEECYSSEAEAEDDHDEDELSQNDTLSNEEGKCPEPHL